MLTEERMRIICHELYEIFSEVYNKSSMNMPVSQLYRAIVHLYDICIGMARDIDKCMIERGVNAYSATLV